MQTFGLPLCHKLWAIDAGESKDTFSPLLVTHVYKQKYIYVKLSQCLGTKISRCMAEGN
jgi:hypothetical protein